MSPDTATLPRFPLTPSAASPLVRRAVTANASCGKRARTSPDHFLKQSSDANFTIETPVRCSDKYLPINVKRQAIPLNVTNGESDVPFRPALHSSRVGEESPRARERERGQKFLSRLLSRSLTVRTHVRGFFVALSIVSPSLFMNVPRTAPSP